MEIFFHFTSLTRAWFAHGTRRMMGEAGNDVNTEQRAVGVVRVRGY
jgi:hypothetical protein